jgi:predicted lipid-binding transport protein (Tim44 family)
MSYLAEELGQNAARGVRNDVSDVKLLQGDLSESWREDDTDYATVAMRYRSRDIMRDRSSGKVAEGDPDQPIETTELWTFTRNRNGDWRLSAIQET